MRVGGLRSVPGWEEWEACKKWSRAKDGSRSVPLGRRLARFGCGCVAVAVAMQSNSLLACAACYGQSDSAMAKGMNWGIASLLVVVVGVLSGITTFFVYVAKRSASASQPPEPKP